MIKSRFVLQKQGVGSLLKQSERVSPSRKILQGKKLISVGHKYLHYKGEHYKVTGLAFNENSQDVDVIYHPVNGPYKNILFTRPLKQWNDKMSYIDWNGPIVGNEIIKRRFEKIT